jgi:hypothetical protein
VKNKKQHFIPVAYLRGFADNYPDNISLPAKDVNIWIFDREEKRYFRKGLNNAFQFSHYYAMDFGDGQVNNSIEEAFSHNEGNFARISRILYDEHIVKRNAKCRLLQNAAIKESLAYYISLQLRRVPKWLRPTEEFIRKKFNIKDEKELRTWVNWSMSDTGEGNYDQKSFHDVLLNKNWTLFCIFNEQKKFISTDAPFSLFNSDGIGNDETEIWFPINNKMLLHMHRPGINLQVVPLYTLTKKVDRLVDFMNSGIAQQFDRYLYSSSDVFLKSIVKGIDLNLRIDYAVAKSED